MKLFSSVNHHPKYKLQQVHIHQPEKKKPYQINRTQRVDSVQIMNPRRPPETWQRDKKIERFTNSENHYEEKI